MKILQTTDLKKYYGTEPNITRALDGVNFSVEEGEFVAVVGTSGSGKSTMLASHETREVETVGNTSFGCQINHLIHHIARTCHALLILCRSETTDWLEVRLEEVDV